VQELLASNMAQNLQLVVQIAKEYTEQLGADKIIALLEGVNSYNGLYYYLGAYLAFSEDPEVCAFHACVYCGVTKTRRCTGGARPVLSLRPATEH
jgi:hypothetical protein